MVLSLFLSVVAFVHQAIDFCPIILGEFISLYLESMIGESGEVVIECDGELVPITQNNRHSCPRESPSNKGIV